MNSDYIIGSRNPQLIFADYHDKKFDVSADQLAKAEVEEIDDGSEIEVADAGYAKGAPETAEHDLSFDDLLDIINPLQHIPIVNYVYRAITGDQISGFARIAGGGLFGGPLGLVGGVIEAAFNDQTGHGPAETMVAELTGLKDHDTMVAQADRTPKNLDEQIQMASADVPEKLSDQIAAGMPQGAGDMKLDTQIAAATLPPVAPLSARETLPFGGMIDMASAEKAKAPVQVAAVEAKEETALMAAEPAPAAPKPVDAAALVAEGQKFYSLDRVKRRSGEQNLAMPLNSSPDIRMKPLTRSANGVVKPAAVDPSAEARKMLGIKEAEAALAESGSTDAMPGQLGNALPNALIEDMMKMGLDKYQKGLSNGSINTAPAVDIRG